MADQTNEIEKLASKLKDALASSVYDGETGEQTPESAKWEKIWNAASGNVRRPRGEALDKIAQDIAQKITQRGDDAVSDDEMTEIVKTAYQATSPQPAPAAKVQTIDIGSFARMKPQAIPETETKTETTMTAENNVPKPEGQKPENWTEEQIDATWNALTRGGSYMRQGYTPPEVKNTLPVLAGQQPEATPEAEQTATANLPAVIAAQPALEADDEIPAAPLDGVPAVDADAATSQEDPTLQAAEPANDEHTPINSFDPAWAEVTNILYRPLAEQEYIEESLATRESRKGLTLAETPLTPEKLAFLAAYYPGLERTPAFLQAIEQLAQANGSATVAEYLGKQEADLIVRKDVMDAFAQTHPLLDKTNRLPFTHVSMEANEEEGSLPTFVLRDAAKNTYRDDGQKTSVRMKFGATMSYDIARNLAKTYISRRMSPTADGSEQTLQFTVDTGRGPLRTAAGLRMKKENYERSVMLLSVLQEAKAVGIRPEITMAGTGPYSRFELEQIALPGEEAGQGAFKLDAKALTEARAQCPEIMELIDSYNRRNQAPTLDGETPENEIAAEPSLGGVEAAELDGTTAGRRSPTDMLAAAQEAVGRSEIRVPTATPARAGDDGNLDHIDTSTLAGRDRYRIRTGQSLNDEVPVTTGAVPQDNNAQQGRASASRHVSVLTPEQTAASDAASATAGEATTQGQTRSRHVPVLPRPQGM